MVHEEEASLSYTLVTRGHHCNGWPYFLIWLSSWTQTTKLWLNKQICYPLHYGATDFMQKQSKNVCVCVFVFFLLPHSPGSGSWKLKYWLKSPLLMRDTSKIRIKKKQDNKKQWISILLLFWGLYLSMWSWLLLWFCMIKKASEIIYIVKHSLSVEMRFFFINIRRTDFSGCTSLCEAKTIKTGHL